MKYFANSPSRTLSTLALSIGLIGSAWGTTFSPEYTSEPDAEVGKGYFDTTPRSPTISNPGETVGEQRRYVFEYGLKLLERMVWLPSDIEFPIRARMQDLGEWAGVGGSTRYSNMRGEDYGLRNDVTYSVNELAMLTEGSSWLGHEDSARERFGFISLTDRSDYTLNTNFTEGDFLSYLPVILHEGIHMLGMSSGIGSIGEPFGENPRQQNLYDVSVRNLGAENPMPSDMTMEEQEDVKYAGDDVVWVGDSARKHAPLIMREGFDSMSNVNLYAINEGDTDFISTPVAHIAMHNNPDYKESLMAPQSGNTLELGIVAYMLSDMGYGPVVDSVITSPDTNLNALSIHTQAIVSDLVDIPNDRVEHMAVTIMLPQGLSFGAFSDDPADCVVDEANALKAVCTYADLLINNSSMIDVGLVGQDGAYTVELDIEHQQRHVDGVPRNNFSPHRCSWGLTL